MCDISVGMVVASNIYHGMYSPEAPQASRNAFNGVYSTWRSRVLIVFWVAVRINPDAGSSSRVVNNIMLRMGAVSK